MRKKADIDHMLLHFYYAWMVRSYRDRGLLPYLHRDMEVPILKYLINNNVKWSSIRFDWRISPRTLKEFNYYKYKGTIKRKHDTTLSREMLDCRDSVLRFYLNRN